MDGIKGASKQTDPTAFIGREVPSVAGSRVTWFTGNLFLRGPIRQLVAAIVVFVRRMPFGPFPLVLCVATNPSSKTQRS